MINSVRNTVLSVLNKNNYGYISPSDFNLFAKQAQLEVFEEYFGKYNTQIIKENSRLSNTGYADIRKRQEEAIEKFSKEVTLTYNAGKYAVPADCYQITTVSAVKDQKISEAEKISQTDKNRMIMSSFLQPTVEFPMYVLSEGNITVYPDMNSLNTSVVLSYIRYPKTPNWTYMSIGNGEPLYSPSNADFQDFELPAIDEVLLTTKILQYCGMSIREIEAVQFANNEELKQSVGNVQ